MNQNKQKAHKSASDQAQETLDRLHDVKLDEAPTYESSSVRAGKPGNLNPIAPEDRKPSPGPMQTAPADIAASHIAAATSAINVQDMAKQRIESDPRHERDQKVYELGKMGALSNVPPSDAEVAATAARSGLPESVTDKIPKNAKEQVAQDTPRLEEAERITEKQRSGVVEPGEQDGAPKNNMDAMRDEDKQFGGAEGQAQKKEKDQAEAARQSNPAIIK